MGNKENTKRIIKFLLFLAVGIFGDIIIFKLGYTGWWLNAIVMWTLTLGFGIFVFIRSIEYAKSESWW